MNVMLFTAIASLVLAIVMFVVFGKLLEKEVLPKVVHNSLYEVYDKPVVAAFVVLIVWATIMGVMTVSIVATHPTDQWEEVAVIESVDDTCNDDGGYTVIMSNGDKFTIEGHCVENYSIGDEYSCTVREHFGFLTEKGEYKKNH